MQKLVGTELYVFDLTPFEITQQTSDATVIFVQNECIDGYKELNASLADKIKGFNQFVMCVTDPWANGVEPGPEPPTPTTYTFSLGGYDINDHVELYFDDVQQEVHPESYDVAAGTSIKVVPTEDASYYTLISGAEWDSELSAWVATMPEADYSIEIDYSEPVVSTHNIVVSGGTTQLNICGYVNGEATWLEGTYDETTGTITYTYAVGQPFQIDERDFTPTAIDPQLETSQDTLWGVGTSYVMPDSDVAITVQATPQPIEVAFTGDALNDGLTFNTEYSYDPTATYYAFEQGDDPTDRSKAFFVLNCDSGKSTSDFTYSSTDADIVINDQADHFDILFGASGTATFNKAEDPQI